MQEQLDTQIPELQTEEPQVTEESQEEPDYKAKTEELEALVSKLQNDQKSRDGLRRKESDRDAELAGFRDEIAAMRKVLTVTMESFQGGDEFQSQISQINQDAAKSQADRDWNSRYDKEQAGLLAKVQDEEGNLLISEENATKIQTQWQAAWGKAQQGNYDEVYDAQIDAQRMVLQEERRKSDVEKKSLREESKQSAKKALERAGVNDLDTGSAIAGGNEDLHGSALIERGLRNRQNPL